MKLKFKSWRNNNGYLHNYRGRCRGVKGFVYMNLCSGEITDTCNWSGVSTLVHWYAIDGDDYACIGHINSHSEVCYMPKWKWLNK